MRDETIHAAADVHMQAERHVRLRQCQHDHVVEAGDLDGRVRTAATMGQVALPELKRAGYSGALSTATLAAGGTLGILIPPSVVLVIYAILTEQNIAKLFLAAFIPGILAAVGYIIVISLYVRFKPGSAGSMPPMPMAERWKATFKVWPVLVIFLAVVGGIYTGIFTPTEGAAVGAFGTGVAAWAAGGLNARTLRDAIYGTAVATGSMPTSRSGATSSGRCSLIPGGEASCTSSSLVICPWGQGSWRRHARQPGTCRSTCPRTSAKNAPVVARRCTATR